MPSRRIRVLGSIGLLVGSAIAFGSIVGCQKKVSREELGTVVFEAKELPGAGIPYENPEMERSNNRSTPSGSPPSDQPGEVEPAAATETPPPNAEPTESNSPSP